MPDLKLSLEKLDLGRLVGHLREGRDLTVTQSPLQFAMAGIVCIC
jgi:hypothetical protein